MLLIKSQKKQTAFNLASGIFAMLINLGINFFLSKFIVQDMGEEANGFTQLANNFVLYASLITIAFNSMASRFMSVNYHQGRQDRVGIYYSSIVVCNIILCAALLPAAGFIVGNLENLLVIENADAGDVKILFGCVFVNFFINLFVSVAGMSMFVTNTIYYQNMINLARYVLNGVLLFCAFHWLPAKIYYVSLAALILTLSAYPVTRLIQDKLMPELQFSVKKFSIDAVKEMLLSGIWNTVNQCGNMLMTGLDLLLCNLFISPAAMGLLSVAKVIPNAIINLAGMLNNNFAPAVTINWAKGDKGETLRQLRSSMKISSIIVSIPIVTFASFGTVFYSLWMPTLNAKDLTWLSVLTCMAFIPWAGPQALYNVFTATNNLKINSVAFVATGVLNVMIVYYCLTHTDWGIFAVAGVSSTLTIIRNLVITAPYTAKLLGLRWYEFYKDVWTSLFCCFINFVSAALIKYFYQADGWSSLIFSVTGTTMITLALDLCFVLSTEERKTLLNLLRRRLHHG